jgi:hypothetical protein
MNQIKIRKIAIQIAKKITSESAGLAGLLINAEHIYNCIISGNFTPEIEKQD